MVFCNKCGKKHKATTRQECKDCFNKRNKGVVKQRDSISCSNGMQNHDMPIGQQNIYGVPQQGFTNNAYSQPQSPAFNERNDRPPVRNLDPSQFTHHSRDAGYMGQPNGFTGNTGPVYPNMQSNGFLGEDYWAKLDSVLNAKVKQIEDKFDEAVAGLDYQVKTLQSKCSMYEEDIINLKSIVVKQQYSLNRIDSEQRDKNIIISGLNENDIKIGLQLVNKNTQS